MLLFKCLLHLTQVISPLYFNLSAVKYLYIFSNLLAFFVYYNKNEKPHPAKARKQRGLIKGVEVEGILWNGRKFRLVKSQKMFYNPKIFMQFCSICRQQACLLNFINGFSLYLQAFLIFVQFGLEMSRKIVEAPLPFIAFARVYICML